MKKNVKKNKKLKHSVVLIHDSGKVEVVGFRYKEHAECFKTGFDGQVKSKTVKATLAKIK